MAVFVLILTFAVVTCLPAYAAMPSYTGDEAVYAVEEKSGDVITAQNEHKRMYPASTTKMMTTLVALDYVADKMDQQVKIGDEVSLITTDSSKADLKKGDTCTWRQLFYGLLLPSGNDAALAIAKNIGRAASGDRELGTDKAIDKFVSLMNRKATQLQLEDSHFVNPHGLHDANHYTTAADLEKISAAALENPTIRKIVQTKVYSCKLKSGQKKWINTNSLIISTNDLAKVRESSHNGKQYNPYATGVKTGHTDEAGRCLVFSSKDGDKTMIAVILHSDNQIFTQANGVINSLHSDFSRINWGKPSGYYRSVQLKHVHFADDNVLKLYFKEEASSMVETSQKSAYTTRLQLDNQLFTKKKAGVYRLNEDLKSGQQVGVLKVYKNHQLVKKLRLKSKVDTKTRNFVDYLLFFVIAGVIIWLILYLYAKRTAYLRRQRLRRHRQRNERASARLTQKR